MSKKTTRISLGFDPTIQNRKSKIQNWYGWSRREFLSTATLAGTGAVLGLRSDSFAAEPPPETTKLRLIRGAPICQAPQYAAEELLKGEGFAEVQEVKASKGSNTVARIQLLPREKAISRAHTSALVLRGSMPATRSSS